MVATSSISRGYLFFFPRDCPAHDLLLWAVGSAAKNCLLGNRYEVFFANSPEVLLETKPGVTLPRM